MDYISDWSKLDRESRYVAFAIGVRPDDSTYLYGPQLMYGWQIAQQLMAGVYVAMPVPAWPGLPFAPKST